MLEYRHSPRTKTLEYHLSDPLPEVEFEVLVFSSEDDWQGKFHYSTTMSPVIFQLAQALRIHGRTYVIRQIAYDPLLDCWIVDLVESYFEGSEKDLLEAMRGWEFLGPA